MTTNQYTSTNGITLHTLDSGIGKPLILMPGLTANAHSFDGLRQAGLNDNFRTIACDLRGRGLSDKPDSGYSMENHALDIIGLLDHFGINKTTLVGHSYGGLLSLYMAANYPQRVEQIVVIDAAGSMHPDVLEMIKPSVDRLGKSVASWDDYLASIKQLPFFVDCWSETIENHYRADVKTLDNGRVMPRSKREAIIEAVEQALTEDWANHLTKIKQPLLLLNALEGTAGDNSPPVLPYELAQETVNAVENGQYLSISGNHFSMLYGEGAKAIVTAINELF